MIIFSDIGGNHDLWGGPSTAEIARSTLIHRAICVLDRGAGAIRVSHRGAGAYSTKQGGLIFLSQAIPFVE